MPFDAIAIGGGFAGLSAATALAEAGLRAIVVEARPGLGGRATAFRERTTGERVDNGQHVLMGCYDETWRFLRRIGAGHLVRWQTGLAVPMVDRQGRETELRLPAVASPLHLLGGVLAWGALSWRERMSVMRLGPALWAVGSPNGASRLGRDTVRQWLERNGQAGRLSELLWEPLALAALNQSIDRAAAVHLVAVLRRMLGAGPEAAALVLPAVPLDELYAEPARRWLEARGHVVRTGAPARVEIAGGRVRAVRVGTERLEAALVVSAVPWHALAGLFDAPPAELAETLRGAAALASSPIVTVNLWFDRPVMERPLVGLPGRLFQWAFDKRAIFGGAASHLSLVSSGADELAEASNERVIRTAVAEIRQALPAARGAVLRRAIAVRERRSTFSLAPDAPPRPKTVTPIEGFYLAGDWIDTGLPATIESAVVSGHRAAAAALGLSEPL